MKFNKSSISIIPVVALILTFNACSDNIDKAVTPSQSDITVSGKVSNLINQAAPHVKVEIGEQSVVTSSDGGFSVSDVKSPYNLRTTDNVSNEIRYFHGLTAEQVSIPGVGYLDDSVRCEINVTFPPEIVLPGVSGKVIFTDGNYVNAYGQFSQSLPISVWLQDNSPVTGKLILITYKTGASGKIISYENFGQSAPIQVSNGGNYTYNFSLNEVSLNPGEETLSGNINKQPGFDAGIAFYSMTFSNKRTASYAVLITFENITGNNFNIVSPVNLPVQFSNLIYSHTYSGQLHNSELFKLPAGPTGINLDTKSAPELLTPSDNAADVTPSTVFSFTTGTGSGIYQVNLHDQTLQKSYLIYISSNSFSLSNFKDLFPNGISNSAFKWSVDKIGFSNSINEFVTTYNDSPEYFRTNTGERSFKTAE